MMGQAAHYNRYNPSKETAEYGSWRYTAECRRLHHVLETQLVSLPPSLALWYLSLLLSRYLQHSMENFRLTPSTPFLRSPPPATSPATA